MQQKQKWFLAELVFRLHDKHRPYIHHFDKYYLPLHAYSEKEAYQMALIKASSELDSRQDYTKEHLQWEFIGLASLSQIEQVQTKHAHHYPMRTPTDIPAYIRSLREQNADIQTRLTEVA